MKRIYEQSLSSKKSPSNFQSDEGFVNSNFIFYFLKTQRMMRMPERQPNRVSFRLIRKNKKIGKSMCLDFFIISESRDN